MCVWIKNDLKTALHLRLHFLYKDNPLQRIFTARQNTLTPLAVHSANSYILLMAMYQWDGSCFTYFVQLGTYSTQFNCKLKLFTRTKDHCRNAHGWQGIHTRVKDLTWWDFVSRWVGVHVVAFANWQTLIPTLIPIGLFDIKQRFSHYIQIRLQTSRKWEVGVGQCWKSHCSVSSCEKLYCMS